METVIKWNAANMVTIPLMGLLGFAVVGLVLKTVMKAKGSSE